MPSITVRAFAKINLSLRVKDLRPDGFHELQSVLQTISLFDTLKFEIRRGPFELLCRAPGVPADRTNLVWKAAQRLWTAAGRAGAPRDVRVRLDKRIPPQAGLGGGSSDAAGALVGLRRIWKLRLDDEQVHDIAAELGSDVPYFLVGGTALLLGRGEQVFPLEELPRYWVLLLLPPFGVSTRDAYAWLDERRRREGFEKPSARLFSGTLPGGNDLEAAVIDRYPVIGELEQQLVGLGAAAAAMSGSGSAVFGIFKTARRANAAVHVMKRTGVRVELARFVRRRSP
jgi:4-diphosphocytidyl-2-C-methyl-D-erythritol kinase